MNKLVYGEITKCKENEAKPCPFLRRYRDYR